MTKLAQVAVHESGHVVAARALGVGTLAFSLQPLASELGHAQLATKLRTPGECRDGMVIFCAGPVAESVATGEPIRRGGGDEARAWEAAQRLHGLEADPATLQVELDRAEAHARALLLANWPAVQRLAAAMVATQAAMETLNDSFPPPAHAGNDGAGFDPETVG
ncbi:MAG: hypothetical protein WEC36_15800 [Phycisphaeraceae bacterium]